MSNSPCAHAPHGTGSGRRTTPTTRSPAAKSASSGASRTLPSDSWPRTRRSCPGGAQPPPPRLGAEARPLWAGPPPAVLPPGDLLVGAAHAHRDAVDEEVAVVRTGIGYVADLERACGERDGRQGAHGSVVPLTRRRHARRDLGRSRSG